MFSTIPSTKQPNLPASSPRSVLPTSQSISIAAPQQHHQSPTNVKEANKISNNSCSYHQAKVEKSENVCGEVSCEKSNQLGRSLSPDSNSSDQNVEMKSQAGQPKRKAATNDDQADSSMGRTSFISTSSASSDMSRRKQRNPKPAFITSSKEDQEDTDNSCEKGNAKKDNVKSQQSDEAIETKKSQLSNAGNEKYSTSADIMKNIEDSHSMSSASSMSSSSPPPQDLSSMVKVEVHEGVNEVMTSSPFTSPCSTSPSGEAKKPTASIQNQS